MKLQDLVDCSAPLLAERPDEEEYPYWFGGTCFRVRYKAQLYVVTAAHCLKDKTKDEVRVQRHPASRYFVTLTAVFRQGENSLDEDDPDQHDWAILQAVDPDARDQDPLGAVLDLGIVPAATPTGHAQHKLVVRGYPKAICGIDYERYAIQWRAFAGSGSYMNKTPWSNHCHTMRLDDVSEIEDIDGLSGSPVFELAPDGPKFRPSFVGLAVRGSKESSLLHFLDARVVHAALERAHNNRRM